MKLRPITEGISYYANGFTFRIVKEDDGWFSIYRLNEITGKYMQQLQSKDLAHAKTFCDFCEPKTVPLQRL